MRLSLAAGILAQALPLASSDASANDVSVDVQQKIQSLLQTTAAFKKKNAQGQQAQQDDQHPRKKVALAKAAAMKRGDSRVGLKNLVKSETPCDPSKFDADTGILSCGEGAMCVESTASPMGGVCAKKEKRSKPLKNDTPLVECDPSKDVDVGILGCEKGQQCKESQESSLGGYCADNRRRRGRQLIQQQQRRRKLDDYSSEYLYCLNYGGCPEYGCDYSQYDNTTMSGVISCYIDNYLLGSCGANATYADVIEDGVTVESTYSYYFFEPYAQSFTITYFGYSDECELIFNGETCDICNVGNSTVYEGDICADFDCTNIMGGVAGTTCDGDFLSLLPIYDQCYGDPCNICEGGNLTNIYALAYGNLTCADVYLAYAFELSEGQEYCTLGQQYFGDYCCGNSTDYYATGSGCDICGNMTLANPDFVLDPEDGSTCYDLYNTTISYLSPGFTCDYVSIAAAAACCGGEVMPPPPAAGAVCSVCPDDVAVTNPDATIQAEGTPEVSCKDLQDLGLAGQIDPSMCTMAQNAVPAICGCGEATSDVEPYVCNICGDEGVKNPDLMINIPTQGEQSCSTIEAAGTSGAVTEAQCPLLKPIVAACCEEGDVSSVTEAPTGTSDDDSAAVSSFSSVMTVVGMSLAMVGYMLA